MTLGHFLSSEYDEIVPLAGGGGGQGTVFKARHREFGQLRAVKWLHGSIESNPADKDQPNKVNRLYEVFLREARNLMQLNTAYHPNIVRIYNARLIQHYALWFPILEMELIEGSDLNTLIEQGGSVGLPVMEVEHMFGQMASALAHCHRLNVIHRDIKSHNVMKDEGAGRFVLVDYGLSLLAGEAVSQERRGTPQYMSPEQYEGLDPSYQSDIYSLGVVIYEALTGQLPFGPEPSNDHWRFYSHSHLHSAVIPVRSLRPEVPPWLAETVQVCLAKDPFARFSDGQVLVSHLDAKRTLSQSSPAVPTREPVAGQTLPAPEWARGQRPTPSRTEPFVVPPVIPPKSAANYRMSGNQERPPSDSPTQTRRWGRRIIGVLLLVLGLGAVVYWLTRSNGTQPRTVSGSVDAGDETMSQASAFQRAGQYSQAAEIYQRLIDQGDPAAYKPLFKLYMGGRVGGEDRCQKALTLLQAAADANDYQACNLLGYVYEYGEYINRGTGKVICRYEPDAELAFEYVQKAAVGGNQEAMRQLAMYHQRGFGTVANEQEAAHWREEARQSSSVN